MKKLRIDRPSPALIISIVALVFAMIGTGYAAVHSKLPAKSVGTKQLKANSVTTKQLKANSVTTAKIKKNAVTGVKVKDQSLSGADINLSTLGAVPLANVANTANALPAPELHVIGAPGQPGFLNGASNLPGEGPIQFVPAAFFKDHDGVVHLEGGVEAGSGPAVFTLPPGFRPASGKIQLFSEFEVIVFGSNVNFEGQDFSGAVYTGGGGASLSGITFRAES